MYNQNQLADYLMEEGHLVKSCVMHWVKKSTNYIECTYTYIYLHITFIIFIYIYLYIYIYIIYIYIYIYIYVYIHTYTHTHIHTHIYKIGLNLFRKVVHQIF